MSIQTVVPSSAELRKYIECFYSYHGAGGSMFKYIAFPHYNTGLSFFKNAEIIRKPWYMSFKENNTTDASVEILGKFLSPIFVEYMGQVQEISIVFKPLGVCRFFREHYQDLAPEFSQAITNQSWIAAAQELFHAENTIEYLESFLLQTLENNQTVSQLELTLPDLINNSSVADVARKHDYNLKTYERHFKKHLGCSPVEYKRIHRFRNSVSNMLRHHDLKSLTEITYDSGYFDQSYFIKEFRKLTHRKPTAFFKRAHPVDGDKFIWEIL